jgi:hypothetical protein
VAAQKSVAAIDLAGALEEYWEVLLHAQLASWTL